MVYDTADLAHCTVAISISCTDISKCACVLNPMTHRTSVPTPHPYTTTRCHPATRCARMLAPTHQSCSAPKQAAHALVSHGQSARQGASKTYAKIGLAVFQFTAPTCIVPPLVHVMIFWQEAPPPVCTFPKYGSCSLHDSDSPR
jgi:hypothetical protein